MALEIAQYARDYERRAGHEIPYSEMVCNQFVIAVLRATVDPGFPMIKADQFPQSPRFYRVESPAAGDLVHWPGHIGIVLDPDSGEFIGSQNSTGVAISNFKTGWWNSSGGKRPDGFLRWAY
jgi:hypothetical protein